MSTTGATSDLGRQRIAFAQMAALLLLCGIVFAKVLVRCVDIAIGDPDSAHLLAAPLLLGVLAAKRWSAFRAAIRAGSWWGFVIVAASLAVHGLSIWPFNFGLPHRLALIPALGGVIVAAAGWRAFVVALPLLLLLLLAMPHDSRFFAGAIIRPEVMTLDAVRFTLDLIPGIYIEIDKQTLFWERGAVSGTIALGESNRGAQLFLAYATIPVFVTFVRFRPAWQIAAMAVVAVFVVFFSNYARLLTWGLISIVVRPDPANAATRIAAIVISLVAAYVVSIIALGVINRLVTGVDESSGKESRHA